MREQATEQQQTGKEPPEITPLEAEAETAVSDTGGNDVSVPGEAGLREMPQNLPDDEAFREAVRKSAQSMKDKELASVYAELNSAREELAQLRRERSDKADAAVLAEREAAEQQAWGKTGEVGDFQAARRELAAGRKQLMQDTAAARQMADKLQTEAKRQEATALAFKHLLPDDSRVISRVETLVQALLEAETSREMVLLAKVKADEMRREGETNRKRPKIDSSIHSAGGGLNVEKLSPSDKIALGLEQVNRRQGRV